LRLAGNLRTSLLLLLWRGRGFEGEKFRFELDGAFVAALGKVNDGAEGIPGFSLDGDDLEVVFGVLAMGIETETLVGFLAIDDGDAEATLDGGDADEGVVFQRVGAGDRAIRRRWLGGERGVAHQLHVFGQRLLARKISEDRGDKGQEEEEWFHLEVVDEGFRLPVRRGRTIARR
jgi:hypothetical protein